MASVESQEESPKAAKKEKANPQVGIDAAARLRELFALAQHGAAIQMRTQAAARATHHASERLADAVCAHDVQEARAAWEQGGRLELADQLRALGEAAKPWAQGARMWTAGWIATQGRHPGKALEMAQWLDQSGCLFALRNRKLEEEARAAKHGSAEWFAMRLAAARQWPKMFEDVEKKFPGVAKVLCFMVKDWRAKGAMGDEEQKAIANVLVLGACGHERRVQAQLSAWLHPVVSKEGLGEPMDDASWMLMFRQAVDDDAALSIRSLLEQAALSPSVKTLSSIAALAAVRGDPLLMAAAAERMGRWDWMVDSDEAHREAQRDYEGGAPPMVAGSAGAVAMAARRGGKIPALHASAMGAKGRRPWNNLAIMALLSIPEARARAAQEPCPSALIKWRASDVEWASQHAPELLALDSNNRCVAHEWAQAFGPSAVKRVAALATGSCGWMMAQQDAKGATPMQMVEIHQKAKDLRALYAGWESGSIERETLAHMEPQVASESDRMRGPRL
jgi:hypothetical protein